MTSLDVLVISLEGLITPLIPNLAFDCRSNVHQCPAAGTESRHGARTSVTELPSRFSRQKQPVDEDLMENHLSDRERGLGDASYGPIPGMRRMMC